MRLWAMCLAGVSFRSSDVHGREPLYPSTQQSRSCDFYESHAFPATYNVDLNVSCDDGVLTTDVVEASASIGLALRTARAFPAGESIVWLPQSSYIWEPNIPWQIRHAVADVCVPRAYAECVLAVALLVERRDAHSRFKYYIAALAQITVLQMRNIVTFARDHLQVLNVTRPDLVDGFETAMRCIRDAQVSIAALIDVPASHGEQLWAYGIVTSRAVKIKGRLALVPVLDLANHAYPASGELTVLEPGGTVALRSLRDLAAGEEITLVYGARMTNLELLAKYGFVDQKQNDLVLPYDFNNVFQTEKATNADDQEEISDLDSCEQALRLPQLRSDAPLLLDAEPEKCLQQRLVKYFEHHYTEIDLLDNNNVQHKALELIGQLCEQLLSKYKQASGTINRLRQHGQLIKDWVSLELTHCAIDDMRLLDTCITTARSHATWGRTREL